jgi:hypothetical protein
MLLKRSRGERPAMQGPSAHAEGIVQALVRPGTEAVQRNGKTFYAKLGHFDSLPRAAVKFGR